MSRAILAVTAMATLLVAGPALAFQCPKLINKIHNEADSRLDDRACREVDLRVVVPLQTDSDLLLSHVWSTPSLTSGSS